MARVLVTGGSGFIGTHLIRALGDGGEDVISVDIRPPRDKSQVPIWRECDIKSKSALLGIIREIQPAHVIHLAAKANLKGRTIEDFPDNTVGTSNVVECVNEVDSVQRFVHTSTQYVVRPGVFPRTDDFLQPYTAYGESKALAEVKVRNECKKCWTIIRPTNIWGPLHPFFPFELWKYLEKRYYLHPGYKPIQKSYGYVGNAVDQILSIARRGAETKHKVFYITDEPIDSYEWMDAFSLALSGKRARRISKALWYVMALAGTALKHIGLSSPLDTDRYFRLTVNESVPYEKTLAISGPRRFSLADGVRVSTDWYRSNFRT